MLASYPGPVAPAPSSATSAVSSSSSDQKIQSTALGDAINAAGKKPGRLQLLVAALTPKYLARGMSAFRAKCAAFSEANVIIGASGKMTGADRAADRERRYDQASRDVQWCFADDAKKGCDKRRSEGVGKASKPKAHRTTAAPYMSDPRFGY